MPRAKSDLRNIDSQALFRVGSDGCTAHHVRRLSRALVRLYDSHMQGTGMTIGQFSLLRGLRPGPLAISELAQLIGADRTTLTRTLAPLLAHGWIIKGAGPDARTRVLQLSELGLEQYRTARTAWRRAQGAVEEAVGNQRIRDFHAAANRIRDQLEQHLIGPVE